jgi:hypothetical protein
MTITAIKGKRGEEQAFCTCQDCGGEETIPARHGDSGRERTRNRFALHLHSEAAVIEALKKRGWSHVKNRLRCPKCTEARNPKQQETPVIEAVKPRAPTAEQEVDIIVTLSAVYDRKAKRYSGTETDRTVAETVGGGCMPGWVAQIRQDKFGPAGNEEAEAIRAEIEAIRSEAGKKLDALSARLDALYRSEDKRMRA